MSFLVVYFLAFCATGAGAAASLFAATRSKADAKGRKKMLLVLLASVLAVVSLTSLVAFLMLACRESVASSSGPPPRSRVLLAVAKLVAGAASAVGGGVLAHRARQDGSKLAKFRWAFVGMAVLGAIVAVHSASRVLCARRWAAARRDLLRGPTGGRASFVPYGATSAPVPADTWMPPSSVSGPSRTFAVSGRRRRA